MPHVLRVAIAERSDDQRMAELRRIFGADVTVETVSSPSPSVIVGRAHAVGPDAIVFDTGTRESLAEVAMALPDMPRLGVIRREQETRDRYGYRRTEQVFDAYGLINERGEVERLEDGSLSGHRAE